MSSVQHFFGSQLSLKQPPPTDQALKFRQNYAPFINKSPRFQATKAEAVSSLPRITIYDKTNESRRIHMLKTQVQANQSQFFFGSRISRFQDEKDQADIPMFYSDVAVAKGKINSPIKYSMADRVLPKVKTIPSIPDCRNKFGYNCQLQRLTLVQKSQKQLQRERSLMREYKESLVQQKIQLKKQRQECFFTKAEKQLSQRARTLLQKQNVQQRLTDKNKMHLFKPKYGHLYKWKPEGTQLQLRLPNFPQSIQKKDSQRSRKFQFFNCCQKRFKDDQNDVELSRKPQVRVYLQNIRKSKDDTRQ